MKKVLKKSGNLAIEKVSPEQAFVLGIDQSLNGSAFVWMKNFKVVDFKFFTNTISKSHDPHAILNREMDTKRLDNIFSFADNLLKNNKFDNAAIEDYAFAASKSNSVFQLGGLGEMLRLQLYRSGIAFRTYEPSKVKKFATGSGSAEKSEMVLAAYKDGFDVGQYGKSGEDLADAYWIAKMLTIEIFLHRNKDYINALNKTQQQVFTEVTKAYPTPLLDRPFYK